MQRSIIKSTGGYLPAKRVANEALSELMETSNEWIVQRTGIEARHWVDEGEDVGTSDLADEASIIALGRAGWSPEELDLIVFATMTPDVKVPGSGPFLQNRLGAERVNIPEEKIYNHIQRYENTIAATIPIALDELMEKSMLKPEDTIMFRGLGAGLTWGNVIYKLI